MMRASSTRKRARKKSTCCSSSSPSPSPSRSRLPSTSTLPLPTPDVSSGEENGDKKRFGMLVDLELLNCPVCFEAFSDLIFQCDNGHLACSSCSTKLRNKCPNCTLPIGNIRCRAVENIVESITVPCQNSTFGCTQIFSSKDQKTHKKVCLFTPCSCPLQGCNYTGHYKDLYQHFDSKHQGCYNEYSRYVCDTTIDVWMHVSDKIYVLKEGKECLLFVVQCFREENGAYVHVSCVVPFGVELGKFSYRLSMSFRGDTITYESTEIRRVQEVEFEKPEENFMFVPRYFNGHLKMQRLIRKWNPKSRFI